MRVITVTLVVFGLAVIGLAQAPQALYRVTIVSRTTKAINYGYLTAPTRIDFAGTPLLNGSRGEATVEPKRGSTLITARFKNVPPPSRFGAQFLTYVVWAISPEGRAQNLGELSLNGSGNGKLETSTPMQTFAMIVTAEPYYSVSQPSDVVVLENRVGSETVGRVEEVNASYEFLHRRESRCRATNTMPSSHCIRHRTRFRSPSRRALRSMRPIASRAPATCTRKRANTR